MAACRSASPRSAPLAENAAAHAENGECETAASEARKAGAAARKRGAGPVAAAISRRLRLYEAGKRFRQGGGGPRPK